MRIAVSGTHCSGKSTLVEDFLAVHPEYIHEPEPYEWLQELYGEDSGDEPGAADFYRQLELSIERLRTHKRDARVIVERSPFDFLAYMIALGDLRRAQQAPRLIERAVELAARGLEHLDLIVVLPLNARDDIEAPESEDPELREAMNDRLVDIIMNDEFDLLGNGAPRVIEVAGPRERRLAAVEAALAKPM